MRHTLWKRVQLLWNRLLSKRTKLLWLLLPLLIAVIYNGYALNWEWVGVGTYTGQATSDFQRYRTLWHWAELIIVPVAIAIVVWKLNRDEKQREERETKEAQRRAESRAERERTANQERQNQSALEAYFDRMEQLVLRTELSDDALQALPKFARAKTLGVLSSLQEDITRQQQVYRFIREVGLINPESDGVENNGELGFLQGAT